MTRVRRTCVVVLLLVAMRAHGAESLNTLVARANALAAKREFVAAERVAREAVARHPKSRDARLVLARVLLWEGRYAEARPRFAALVHENADDREARLGLAQAEYWGGDYRAALRDFRALPNDAEARRAIDEIRSASRPGYRIGADALSDDQPYRAAGGGASLFVFSDPLTRWQLDVDSQQRHGLGLDASTPFVRASVETALVPARVTARAALARMRFADDATRTLPSLAADVKLGGDVVTASASREPLLRSAASLRTHPFADTYALQWRRGDAFAVHAQHLRYFDRNRGNGVDGFLLHRLGAFAVGASAAWRDTDQSRFDGTIYDPYYTPQQLREARIIAAWTAARRGMTLAVHVDGGIGHERLVGAFHPWRAAANIAIPFAHGATFAVTAEHNSTAFYNSNEIHASLAGRF